YSLFERSVEDDVLPTCEELGVGFLAYSPLGRGLLAGRFRSLDELDETDKRRTGIYPRLVGENLERNVALVGAIADVAGAHRAPTAQVALAWRLARREWIVPIPGTRRIDYLEENLAATELELPSADLEQLDSLVPAGGGA